MSGQPTFGPPPEQQFASEDEWLAYEESRGSMAMQPEHLPCYPCTREAGGDVMNEARCVWRPVEKLGPVCEPHRDPTQSYKLACGHTTI